MQMRSNPATNMHVYDIINIGYTINKSRHECLC